MTTDEERRRIAQGLRIHGADCPMLRYCPGCGARVVSDDADR